MSATPTIFLDRDGVINRRIIDGYVKCLDELEILPGVTEALTALHQAGWRCAVVTNQRGIARGLMTREAVDLVHAHLSEVLGLSEFYVCPHERDSGCSCRKPAPGLLDQAHACTPVDWQRSWLIGDSDSDIVAGKARGVTTIKVAGPGDSEPDFIGQDLVEAVAIVMANTSS